MKKPGMHAKSIADKFLTYSILIIVSLIFVFPCFWLVISCFSKSGDMYSFNGFFPSEYSFDSFKLLFTDTVMYNYMSWFTNTLFVAIVSSLLGTVLVILTAYTISTFEFRGRKALMKGALVLGMFPSFMGMTAVYLLMTQFGFINSHLGLALIYAGGAPMGYLVQKGFFDTIPKSLEEAARIDGAGVIKDVSIRALTGAGKEVTSYQTTPCAPSNGASSPSFRQRPRFQALSSAR